jgi:hypothetical protein
MFFLANTTILATAVVLPSTESLDATLAFQDIEAREEVVTKKEVKATPQVTGPFTGKITGSRVRLRLQPNLDGLIIKELNQGDLVVVTDELEDFYAIKPDSKWKGYIYRTYVLDDTVEANNVNLRLEPDTHAPVLAQLSQGDRITGTICEGNNKWIMVDLPESVRFYVAKAYITKAGDASLFQRSVVKKEELTTHLDSIELAVKKELAKPFQEIQLISYVNELKTIVAQNQEFPEQSERAQALIKSLQEEYLAKSSAPKKVSTDVAFQPVKEPESTPEKPSTTPPTLQSVSFALEEQESEIVAQAMKDRQLPSKEAFYADEVHNAQELSGQLIPYERLVKNRPGDFILVDTKTKVPIAYLYSTRVNLQQYIGQTIRLTASPRPNHHFALPAYFVLNIQTTSAFK